MSFPKESNKFPVGGGHPPVSEGTVAAEIAKALRRELGHSHAAVKTVAQCAMAALSVTTSAPILASGSAFDAVRFHTCTSWPTSISRAAIMTR